MDITNDTGYTETFKPWLDSASQSSTPSTPSQPSHKDRTSIDDFDIIKPISSGAYGKVFLARKRTTGDFFAIKVLVVYKMVFCSDSGMAYGLCLIDLGTFSFYAMLITLFFGK